MEFMIKYVYFLLFDVNLNVLIVLYIRYDVFFFKVKGLVNKWMG